jgi:hypothetical protein
MAHQGNLVFLGQAIHVHLKGASKLLPILFCVGCQGALHTGVKKVPVQVHCQTNRGYP